jgi:hypothetical protein
MAHGVLSIVQNSGLAEGRTAGEYTPPKALPEESLSSGPKSDVETKLACPPPGRHEDIHKKKCAPTAPKEISWYIVSGWKAQMEILDTVGDHTGRVENLVEKGANDGPNLAAQIHRLQLFPAGCSFSS